MSTLDPTQVASAHLAHLEDAWNRADGGAFGNVFAEETDFVDIRGAHHRGDGTVIGLGHQALFDSIYAGSTIHYQLEHARLLVPGSIVAVATATLDAPTGPLRGTNRSRLTATIVEQAGRWSIAAFQNTLVSEAA